MLFYILFLGLNLTQFDKMKGQVASDQMKWLAKILW